MQTIPEIQSWIAEQDFRQRDLSSRAAILSSEVIKLEYFQTELEESSEIIKNAAMATQEQVKYQITEAGTLALQSIFDNEMEIAVDFGIKRNQTECVISFVKKGEKYSPSDESGQGAADIAGFGLRVALWSLPANKARPVLILDEPFKHLKGSTANIAAIQAVKKLSEQLGIQIIMVSDERVGFEEIEKGADRVIKVLTIDGKSQIQILK